MPQYTRGIRIATLQLLLGIIVEKVGVVFRGTLKAIFCVILSWILILITLDPVLRVLGIALPVGLLALPASVAMFIFFTKLEKGSRQVD